ncbi:MAG: hypothetical protein FJW68_05925 [Actinobacteria bacterium]|nr:hypothetical protein [Actinomycetota bacterium]
MMLTESKVLSKDEIEKIHQASLEILNSAGVKIFSKRVLDFLGNFNFARIDKKSLIVKFSPDSVLDILKKAPHHFKLFSQDKATCLEIGKRNYHLINGHCAAFYYDFLQKKRRRILKKEVEEFAVLSDYLYEISIAGIEGLPADIRNEKAALTEGAGMTLCNTSKPFHYTPENIFDDNSVKELIKISTGSGELAKKPSLVCMVVNLSPLAWPEEIAEVLLANSFEGIPLAIMVSPYSGVSAPYTIAGQIALFNAEVLSGVLINQLANPGCPVIYGCSCASFDMGLSVTNIATPETALMRIALAQMAGYYGIPSMTSAPDTDSNCFDEQNGWEKIITSFTSFASGINLILNAGLFSTGTEVSYSQLLMDCEIIRYVKRMIEGIKVDSSRLAVNVIEEAGPLGNFLLSRHTLEYLRKGEYLKSWISNRHMHSQWESRGLVAVDEAANNEALRILQTHKPCIKYETIKKIKKYISNIKV